MTAIRVNVDFTLTIDAEGLAESGLVPSHTTNSGMRAWVKDTAISELTEKLRAAGVDFEMGAIKQANPNPPKRRSTQK